MRSALPVPFRAPSPPLPPPSSDLLPPQNFLAVLASRVGQPVPVVETVAEWVDAVEALLAAQAKGPGGGRAALLGVGRGDPLRLVWRLERFVAKHLSGDELWRALVALRDLAALLTAPGCSHALAVRLVGDYLSRPARTPKGDPFTVQMLRVGKGRSGEGGGEGGPDSSRVGCSGSCCACRAGVCREAGSPRTRDRYPAQAWIEELCIEAGLVPPPKLSKMLRPALLQELPRVVTDWAGKKHGARSAGHGAMWPKAACVLTYTTVRPSPVLARLDARLSAPLHCTPAVGPSGPLQLPQPVADRDDLRAALSALGPNGQQVFEELLDGTLGGELWPKDVQKQTTLRGQLVAAAGGNWAQGMLEHLTAACWKKLPLLVRGAWLGTSLAGLAGSCQGPHPSWAQAGPKLSTGCRCLLSASCRTWSTSCAAPTARRTCPSPSASGSSSRSWQTRCGRW